MLNGNSVRKTEKEIEQLKEELLELKATARDIKHLEKYKKIFEISPEAIILLDPTGTVIDANGRVNDWLGYPPEEIIGKNIMFLPFFSKKVKMRALMNLGKRLRGIEIPPYDLEFYGRDGNILCGRVIATLLRTENGGIAGDLVMITNITEQKKAEKRLIDNERKFRTLTETTSSAIFIVKDNKFCYMNKAGEKICGYSLEELKGKNFWEIVHPDHRALAKERAFGRLQHKDVPQNYEMKIITSSGEIKWMEFMGSYLEYEGIPAILGTGFDITQRKEMEEHLRISEEKFRSIYENATIGLYRSTPAGKILMTNPTLLKILGFNNIEAMNSFDIEKEGYSDRETRKRFIEYLQANDKIFNFENLWRRPDGKIVYISESARVIKNKKGIPLYYDGTIEDVTIRKEQEEKIRLFTEELKELNATKDKFFSIIAHDLKNPFVSILGFSEILSEDFPDLSDTEKKELINEIFDAARKAHNLLQNLLTWSRSQRGMIKVDLQNLNLAEMVKEAVEPYEGNATNKNIAVRISIPEHIHVHADKYMLETTIGNITNNAIKFTRENGKVEITAEENSSRVFLMITDNGVGMSKEQQEKLFDVGTHCSTKGTADESGTGLGLILCKDFIEKQKGKISIKSAPDEGSTFIIELQKWIDE